MADQPRTFSRASTGGNPVGRPATHGPESSGPAKAMIAATHWQQKRGAVIGQGTPTARSAQSGAAISAARGQYRSERRFSDESNFFNPNTAANGGSGTSPKNPWS